MNLILENRIDFLRSVFLNLALTDLFCITDNWQSSFCEKKMQNIYGSITFWLIKTKFGKLLSCATHSIGRPKDIKLFKTNMNSKKVETKQFFDKKFFVCHVYWSGKKTFDCFFKVKIRSVCFDWLSKRERFHFPQKSRIFHF